MEVKAATGRLFAVDVEQLREALFNEEGRKLSGVPVDAEGCGRRC